MIRPAVETSRTCFESPDGSKGSYITTWSLPADASRSFNDYLLREPQASHACFTWIVDSLDLCDAAA
jgi:hypothetical protein